MGRVQDRVTIVTGSGEGIGRSMARLFAAEGAPVVLAARRAELLEETARLVRDAGGEALVVPTDVTVEEQVVELVRRTVDAYGRVDVLLNNAAAPGRDLHVWEQTLENWNATIAVDVTGPMLCTREVLRQSMIERRAGVVLNFSSTASWNGIPRKSHYSVAKAGLRLLTKVTAQEVGPLGIRCNCIVVGGVGTDLLVRYWHRIAGERGIPWEDVRAETAERTALRKVITPDEMAAVALWLASDEAGIITGQSVTVDCGQVMVG